MTGKKLRHTGTHERIFVDETVRGSTERASDQDTLLDGIADIYVEFAKLDCHRYDLPHAENSHFIQFTYRALRPFFGLTEASLKAISKRWKRLKDAHKKARHSPISG